MPVPLQHAKVTVLKIDTRVAVQNLIQGIPMPRPLLWVVHEDLAVVVAGSCSPGENLVVSTRDAHEQVRTYLSGRASDSFDAIVLVGDDSLLPYYQVPFIPGTSARYTETLQRQRIDFPMYSDEPWGWVEDHAPEIGSNATSVRQACEALVSGIPVCRVPMGKKDDVARFLAKAHALRSGYDSMLAIAYRKWRAVTIEVLHQIGALNENSASAAAFNEDNPIPQLICQPPETPEAISDRIANQRPSKLLFNLHGDLWAEAWGGTKAAVTTDTATLSIGALVVSLACFGARSEVLRSLWPLGLSTFVGSTHVVPYLDLKPGTPSWSDILAIEFFRGIERGCSGARALKEAKRTLITSEARTTSPLWQCVWKIVAGFVCLGHPRARTSGLGLPIGASRNEVSEGADTHTPSHSVAKASFELLASLRKNALAAVAEYWRAEERHEQRVPVGRIAAVEYAAQEVDPQRELFDYEQLHSNIYLALAFGVWVYISFDGSGHQRTAHAGPDPRWL
jgi:hypothetical protein